MVNLLYLCTGLNTIIETLNIKLDMTSTLLSKSFIQQVRTSSKILRAVDHRLRQRMLEQMDLYGSLNPEALAGLLNVKPSLVAHHLEVLKQAHVVDYSLEGKQFFYSVNYSKIKKINSFIKNLNEMDY
jgi:DNA-binding transcriptional ArsR family regulator